MGVKDYDLNPDNNTQINGINIAEGCPPSGINNAIRQLMADVKADKDAQDKATVKTVNGNAPDAAGNITPEQTGCLPLTGGTVTGDLLISKGGEVGLLAASNSEYRYVTLTATGTNAANFQAFRQDSPLFGGAFICRAMDVNGNLYDLIGRNDGTLTWRDSPVLLPPGAVFAFAANSAPAGCLLCNGAAVSRTTYERLFAVIGGTYGVGDGSTTFNLPNLTGRFIQGSETAGTYIAAGLPNIVAVLNNTVYTDGYCNAAGAFYTIGTAGCIASVGVGVIGPWDVGFSAQRFNSIYGNSTTVQPPAVTMRYYIKY